MGMPCRLLPLLFVATWLLATACADQSSFGPTGPTGDDHRPAVRAASGDSTITKGGTGGSAGGLKGGKR
jgi:hypothetical protein